jgi:hypothetical protein
MGPEVIGLAKDYAQIMESRELWIERIVGEGHLALVRASALGTLVADSAAAGTAMATGERTANGMISMNPQGKPLTTILEIAKRDSRSVGIVTSTRLTHATPACFVAHSEALRAVSRQDASFEYLGYLIGKKPSTAELKKLVREHIGIELTDAEATFVLKREPVSPFHVIKPKYRELGYPIVSVGPSSWNKTWDRMADGRALCHTCCACKLRRWGGYCARIRREHRRLQNDADGRRALRKTIIFKEM